MSEVKATIDKSAGAGVSRRRFFGYAGALAGAGILAASLDSCRKDDDPAPYTGIDLGSGDTGVLNYAYALEQLEAAFYTAALASLYSGATAQEQQYLTEIRDHEIGHRATLKAALGTKAIPDLRFDFSSVDFSSRASVLSAARSLEDLGVSAYNGAAILFSDPNNLLLAGKIASVEGRHSAVIRELLEPNSFADTSVLNYISRIDAAQTPTAVLQAASKYFLDLLNAGNLPTT